MKWFRKKEPKYEEEVIKCIYEELGKLNEIMRQCLDQNEEMTARFTALSMAMNLWREEANLPPLKWGFLQDTIWEVIQERNASLQYSHPIIKEASKHFFSGKIPQEESSLRSLKKEK